jgi:Tol biopolymer transport system component/DNA-binding winged helix-turn-helix (wHTH) protein
MSISGSKDRLAIVHFSVFEFNPRIGELRRRGFRVKFQGQPVQLLTLLLERPGEIVTREEMRARLWPEDTFVDFEHSLNTAIKKLRKTLGDSAARPRFIETCARQGYRFIASIQLMEPSQTPATNSHLTSRNDHSETENTTQSAPAVAAAAIEPATVRSRRKTSWFLGVGILILAGLGLFAVLHRRSPSNFSPQWKLTLLTSGEDHPADPAISPDGKMLAYVADAGERQRRIFVRRVAGGRRLRLSLEENVREAEPVFSPDSERIAYTRFVAPFNVPEICITPALGGDVTPVISAARYPAWSPDGSRLAFILERPGELQQLATATIEGGALHILLAGDSVYPFLRYPSWSPDGRWIAVELSMGGASGEIWLVPSQGGPPQRLESTRSGVSEHHPVFSWDGQGVIYSSNRAGATDLWRHSIQGGADAHLTQGPDPDGWPSVSRDGNVAFLNSDWKDQLFIRQLDTGATLNILNHAPFLWAPAISPDGREIAFSRAEDSGQWRIWVVGTTAGAKARPLSSGDSPQIYGRFSADGKWITYFTWVPGASRIWRIPRLGGPPEPLTPGNEDAAYGDLSPDGRLLAFARTEDQIARIAVIPVEGGPEKSLTDSPSTVPRWSPDGRWIAFSPDRGYEGGVFIIRPDGSGLRRLTPSGGWPVWFPDGKRVAFRALRPDGTQQIKMVHLDSGKVEPWSDIEFSGDNYPFDFSRDGKLMVYTNGVILSSGIWLLNSPR